LNISSQDVKFEIQKNVGFAMPQMGFELRPFRAVNYQKVTISSLLFKLQNLQGYVLHS